MKQTMVIVGLGLIGGSLALALKGFEDFEIVGVDVSQPTLRFAAEHGLPVTASAYMPVFAGARQHTGRIESFDAQTLRFEGGISVERKAVARLEAEC